MVKSSRFLGRALCFYHPPIPKHCKFINSPPEGGVKALKGKRSDLLQNECVLGRVIMKTSC